MNQACLRWALEAAEYLANRFDGDCYKVLVQMSKGSVEAQK